MAHADDLFLCVYASQAAACIGENAHKKMCDAAEQVWERADPKGYHTALARNRIVTDDQILETAAAAHSEISSLLRSATVEVPSSTDVVAKYSTLATKFREFADENKLLPEQRRVVDDALRKTSYTTYGNQEESAVFRYLRDTLGMDCVEDPKFYKTQAGVVDTPRGPVPWYIGGKIDAITADRKLVIEIKNRVNRLFRRAPSYELVQVQTYLWLLDVDDGVLVECMKTRDSAKDLPHEDVGLIRVPRDRKLWQGSYFPRLAGFVDFVGKLACDESVQDKFLRSKRQNAMIAAHVAKFIEAHGPFEPPGFESSPGRGASSLVSSPVSS